MPTGLIIQKDKNINEFNYSLYDYDNDYLHNYCICNGGLIEEFNLLESFDVDNGLYLVFGWKLNIHNIEYSNEFDLMSGNASGDIIIIKVDDDLNMNPINIDKNEIRNFYTEYQNIGLYSSEDYSSIGEYDYNDGFLVRDSDEEDFNMY